jgi:hypothetical protein
VEAGAASCDFDSVTLPFELHFNWTGEKDFCFLWLFTLRFEPNFIGKVRKNFASSDVVSVILSFELNFIGLVRKISASCDFVVSHCPLSLILIRQVRNISAS